jgi:hypothetical protein
MNPATEAYLAVADIVSRPDGFVGVQHGIGGLLRYMMLDDVSRRSFQFTTAKMTSRNWLPLQRFKALVEYQATGRVVLDAVLGDQEHQSLHSSIIDWLATRASAPFFVGIQGGELGLRSLHFEEIDQASWQVARTKETSQWMSAETFRTVYEEKRAAFDALKPESPTKCQAPA